MFTSGCSGKHAETCPLTPPILGCISADAPIDDGWVQRSHKVCIFNISFLTPQLATEVQQLLKQDCPTGVVWFQIEVEEPGVEVPLPGIRVFVDRIEHDWDRDKLRSILGDRFAW
jgi:hypothetical protein